MATEREEIIVRCGFDNTTLERGMRTAGSMINDFAKGMAEKFVAFFAVDKVMQFERSLGDLARTIKDTSTRLGLSVEQVQKLQYAASQTDTELESVAAALDKIAKAKIAALAGSKNSTDAFADFGISLEQIQDASPIELFTAMSESLEKTGVNAKVTADMMELLGRNGGALIPVMTELKKLSSEAPVLSDTDIKEIEQAKHARQKGAADFTSFGAWIQNQALNWPGFFAKMMPQDSMTWQQKSALESRAAVLANLKN